jgi:hypothetical protein
MNPSESLQEDKYKEKSMMMMMKGLSPSSIYMGGKGGQQYNVGLKGGFPRIGLLELKQWSLELKQLSPK